MFINEQYSVITVHFFLCFVGIYLFLKERIGQNI